MLDYALDYASRGWRIIPLYEPVDGACACGEASCSSIGKHPRTQHGVHDATTDALIIEKWWRRSPTANIGCATGDVFDVVDLDGPAAMQTFAGWCLDNKVDSGIFPSAVTGRADGGRHIYFASTGRGNGVGLALGVDYRGRGGYVVLPPSLHQTGTHYTWTAEPIGVIPPAPEPLRTMLSKPGNARETPQSAPDAVVGTAYGAAALKTELLSLLGAVAGQRNDALNACSFSLFQLVDGGELVEDEVTPRLRAAASGIGLSDNEIECTLASARKGAIASPRTAPVVKVVDHVDRAAQRPQVHPPAERPWPNPPGEDAFYGLAGDTVRAMEPHTEADLAATLPALLAVFGNVVGPGPHHLISETKHAAKLWPVLVGRTAKGRKGEAQAQVDAVLGPLDPDWRDQRHASGLASGEGLIFHVRDEVVNFVKDRESGELVQTVTDPGVSDKRLRIVEPEFGRTLRVAHRDGNSLSPLVRDAWDPKILQNLTKKDPHRATDSHIHHRPHHG